MSIRLIIGPQRADKTAVLMNALKNEASAKVLLIKHKFDTNNVLPNPMVVTEIYEDGEKGFGSKYHEISHIAIDEGHFFNNIYECAHQWALNGKHVYITAVQSGIFLESIEHICALISIADEITMLKNQCAQCGCQASFNYRTKALSSYSIIDPVAAYYGNKNDYVTVCRRCYHKRLKYEHENSVGLFATLQQTHIHQVDELLHYGTAISSFVSEYVYILIIEINSTDHYIFSEPTKWINKPMK